MIIFRKLIMSEQHLKTPRKYSVYNYIKTGKLHSFRTGDLQNIADEQTKTMYV